MEFLSIHKGQRPDTVRQYEKIVRSFFIWTGVDSLPPLQPSAITRDIVLEWIKHLFYDRGNISPRSRASKLSALRSFFSWLKSNRQISHDPTKGIPSPKVQETLPQKFSTEDLRLLFSGPDLDTAMGLRDLAMLKTMYAAGTRVSELVNLDINHLVDTGGYIRLQIINGKGGKSRTVTMRSNPSRALREWLHIRREIESEDSAIFIRLKGKPVSRLSTKSAENILKKYLRLVGINDVDVGVHKMRATFATDLYDSGNDHCPHCRKAITYVGPVEVAMLLGHEATDLSTVMRYIAVSDRVLRKTAIPDRRFNEIENEG
jgi:site-specific recombinase XerD